MAGQGDEASLRADVPATHVVRGRNAGPASTCFGAASEDVDARHKAGHDGTWRASNIVMAGRGDEASLRADVPATHVIRVINDKLNAFALGSASE